MTVNPDDLTITCATTPLGDILIENGARILANAVGGAGAIKMFAGKNATVNGLVSSEGTLGDGQGGPITIDACCDLIIGDTGKVLSKGGDPGADLVHLQACVIQIFGLVASTGPGHEPPFANLCNVDRLGKPANSSSCQYVVGAANVDGGSNTSSSNATFTFTNAGANSPAGCVPAPPTP